MNCILSQSEIEGSHFLSAGSGGWKEFYFWSWKATSDPEMCGWMKDASMFCLTWFTQWAGVQLSRLFSFQGSNITPINHVSRISDFQVFILVLCDPCHNHLNLRLFKTFEINILTFFQDKRVRIYSSRSGDGKLRPMGQIWLIIWFCKWGFYWNTAMTIHLHIVMDVFVPQWKSWVPVA